MLHTVDHDRNLQKHEYTVSKTNLDPGNVISLIRESSKRTIQASAVHQRTPIICCSDRFEY